jgi:hypothetical protein
MNNIVRFPCRIPTQEASPDRRVTHRHGQKNMHTYLFRSRKAVLEADEAELIRDVCSDIDKAQKKLEKLRARIESFQELADAELQALNTAETKLTAAIVAALLSQAQRCSAGADRSGSATGTDARYTAGALTSADLLIRA